jgi:hypothetical protein
LAAIGTALTQKAGNCRVNVVPQLGQLVVGQMQLLWVVIHMALHLPNDHGWEEQTRREQLLPDLSIQKSLLKHHGIEVVLPGPEDSRQGLSSFNSQDNRLVPIRRQPLATGFHQSRAVEDESNGEGRPGHLFSRIIEVSES